jgi:hypothetical protein
MAQIGEADEEKIRQFNLIKILKYWSGRSIEFIFASKRFIKRKKFRSVMGVMVLTFVMELLLCLCQGEKS